MKGIWLTVADLEPCPYQILTSMGGSKHVRRITKHKVVIQVNHIRPANYRMVYAKKMAM
jgi:hypothetical protein